MKLNGKLFFGTLISFLVLVCTWNVKQTRIVFLSLFIILFLLTILRVYSHISASQ